MDREKVMRGLECCCTHIVGMSCGNCPYEIEQREDEGISDCTSVLAYDALALLKEQQQQIWEFQDQVEYLTDKLKEQKSLLGIQQTADSITFVSTGTAQQGESRGLLLGRYAMYEWLKKELFCRGLLTDDIKAVFDEAKLQESR